MWLTTDLLTTVTNGGTANFMHTASFELVRPEGCSYTPTMGFAAAVPEPANAALVAGFGLLGNGVWRWEHDG
jgi:hypothetical protein